MRLFAALRPPAEVLDHLDQALQTVSPPWLGAGPPPLRWVAPEQRHVTLAFYGEVPDGALDDLAGALTAVAAEHDPLRLQLTGAGIFSRATLWVGARALDDDAALVRLMADCGAAGEGVSHLEPRDRNRAHLTVARLSARQHREEADRRRRSRRGEQPRAPSIDLPALAHALSLYRGPEWVAEQIEVVQSRLGAGRGGGPQHEVVATLPLGT
ncbi:2'-5' RNA ligase [Georgenia satyanarayanai]|uniref:RNA 2',3'-cyclic phosphodiesterase n=1 Tax=Georgenia satyanarayanai TaxID=860221 RepID=A0A2Y9ABV9_9MICO|nr:RNA 2',3'-cyclic phosphodiesterase [Georgenia satyanarayanai]PYF99790.1 2'-5' RNA ligase [Georgenia satyanarayanai]SSA41770.1 2'-5' RNA ligase [Georgenia satyanarayanai]